MMDSKVIVLGGDHYNTLWVVRSLGMAGLKPYLIVDSHSTKSFVAKSRYVQKCWYVSGEEKIVKVLRENFCTETRKPVVICSSDVCADIVDRNYEELTTKFILPNIDGKGGMISHWMDKDVMCKAAKKAGFNVPKTWHISFDSERKYILPGDIVYPCIIKPQKSSDGSKYDFAVCDTESELQQRLDDLEQRKVAIVVQEYLKPDFEISFLGVNLPNVKRNVIPGLLYKLGTCLSSFNMGMPTYACVSPELAPYVDIAVIERFFSIVKYHGLYSIEFFVCKGKAYFLEINLRTDGDMFVYTKAGVNMPLLWVKDVEGEDVSLLPQEVQKVVYGMTEISYMKYLRWKNIKQLFVDLFRTRCFSIFCARDIKPFLFKFIYYWK